MSALPPKSPATAAPFSDAFGYRVLGFDKKSGDRLEMLRLRPQLASSAPFEAALRERQRRLSDFRHPAFARVRQIDRPSGQAAALAVVSNHFEGMRLSDLLKIVETNGVRLEHVTAICMLRQVAAGIARLHECGEDISHGAVNPERLVVGATGRVILTEYVLGAGLEALALSRQQVWQDYRVALPSAAAPARHDHAADIFQLGYIGLTLVGGRSLYERQYPAPFAERLQAAREIQLEGAAQALHPAVHAWLERALWLDAVPFTSAADAQASLEDAVEAAGLATGPDVVVQLLERCFAVSPDARPREAAADAAQAPVSPLDARHVETLVLPAPAIAAPTWSAEPLNRLSEPEIVPTSQVVGLALPDPEPSEALASLASLLVDAQTAARSEPEAAPYVPPATVALSADEPVESCAAETDADAAATERGAASGPPPRRDRPRGDRPRPDGPRPDRPRPDCR